MNERTIWRLRALNRCFYRVAADTFSATRRAPWPGWSRLLPILPRVAERPLRVLDAGCGNGRFGVFLARAWPGPIAYHGVDDSRALLAQADAALAGRPQVEVRLERADLWRFAPHADAYDLVVLFGVLHHVPGGTHRAALVRRMARAVAPGGVLAFTCWRFAEYARFLERQAPWPASLDSEPGDYLLRWEQRDDVLRYCHYIGDAEYAALVAASGLAPVARYRADGEPGDTNLYAVMSREWRVPGHESGSAFPPDPSASPDS